MLLSEHALVSSSLQFISQLYTAEVADMCHRQTTPAAAGGHGLIRQLAWIASTILSCWCTATEMLIAGAIRLRSRPTGVEGCIFVFEVLEKVIGSL